MSTIFIRLFHLRSFCSDSLCPVDDVTNLDGSTSSSCSLGDFESFWVEFSLTDCQLILRPTSAQSPPIIGWRAGGNLIRRFCDVLVRGNVGIVSCGLDWGHDSRESWVIQVNDYSRRIYCRNCLLIWLRCCQLNVAIWLLLLLLLFLMLMQVNFYLNCGRSGRVRWVIQIID